MRECSTFLQSPSYLSWWPEWCHNKPSSTEALRPYGRNRQGGETSASRKAPATWWHIQQKKKHNVWSNTHETQHRCFWSHCLDCCAVSAHDIMSRWWEEWQWERQQILQNWSQEWWQCDMMKWWESRLEMDMMSCFGGSTNKQSMLRVAWAISSELAESWGTGYTFYLLSGEMSPGTPLVKYQKIGTGVWNDGSKFEVAGWSRRQFIQLMGWRAVQAKTHKK